jgi:hypothetical protein
MKRSDVGARFKRWLRSRGYSFVSEDYPAAVHASTLVDEFLDEYPEFVRARHNIEHTLERMGGYVSDYAPLDSGDEPDD